MIEENNKKKSGWRQATTMFFVLLLVGLFLFAEKAWALPNDYNKSATSTLTASEWNNLANDFVKTWTNTSMTGQLGIGRTASYPLDVDTDVFVRRYLGVGSFNGNTPGISGWALSAQQADQVMALSALLNTSNSTGRVLSINASGEPFARAVFYSSGVYGLGGGSGSRDSFIGRSGVNTFKIGSNYDLSGSANLLVTGKLGVGSTTPNDIFSIGDSSGSFAPSGSDRTGHNYTNTYLSTDNYALTNYGVVKTLISDATNPINQTIASSTFWSGSLTGNIWSNNTGNVGIGTTSPSSKLDVYGQTTLGNRDRAGKSSFPLYISDYSNLGWKVSDSNGTAKFELYAGLGGVNEMRLMNGVGIVGHGQDLLLGTDTGTTSAVIKRNTGNVGIGTTTPSAKLQIVQATGVGLDVSTNYDAEGNYFNYGGDRSFRFYRTAGAGENLAIQGVRRSDGMLVNLLLNPQGGSVGIGTSSPSSNLHVANSSGQATLKVESIYNLAGGRADILLKSLFGDTTLRLDADSGANYIQSANYAINGNKPLNFSGYSGNQGSSLSFNFATNTFTGNVGIGTTAPNDILSLANGGSAAPAGSSNTGHNFTSSYISTDNYALANYGLVKTMVNDAVSPITLWGGSTSGDIWSLNSQDVGIGTSNPTSKLHVLGDSYLDGNATSTGYIAITGVSNSAGNLRFSAATPYISAPSYIVIPNGLYVSGGTLYSGAQIRARAGISNDTGAYLTISGGTSTATYFPGTIGIGTTAPTTQLEIKNSTATYPSITFNTSQYGGEIATKKNGGTYGILYVRPEGGETRFARLSGSSVSPFISGYNGSDANTFLINTNGYSFFNGGNVGIGAASAPNDIFSIANSGVHSPATSTNTGHNYTSTYFSSDKYALANYGLVETLITNSSYWSRSGSNLYPTNISDNVGIGTNNPMTKLDVVNTDSARLRITSTLDSGSWVTDGKDFGKIEFYSKDYSGGGFGNRGGLLVAPHTNTGSASFMAFSLNNGVANDVEMMRITSTGNIGIGTTAPQSALHVQSTNVDNVPRGDIILGKYWASNSNTRASSLFHYYDSTQPMDKLVFGVAGTGGSYGQPNAVAQAKMVIQANGSVGIGTTAPSEKLNVLGNALFNITAARLSLGKQGADGDVHFGASGISAPTNGLQDYGFYAAYNAYRSTDGNWYHSRPAGGVLQGAARFTGSNTSASGINGFRWDVSPNNGTSALAWTNLMILTTSGNVGIGTTVPNDILSLANGGSAAPAGSSNTGHNYTSTYLSTDNFALANYGIVKTLVGDAISSSSLWGGTTTGNIWALNSGNIGIGTASPDAKLHVAGDLKVNGSAFINKQHFADNIYSHTNGTLISTNITVSDNQMMELYIEGNSYGAWGAVGGKVTAYNYTGNNTIVGTAYVTDGIAPSEVRVFHQDGVVKFWMPTSSAQTYRFRLATSFGSGGFKITSMSNVAMPTTGVTNEVVLTPKTVVNNSVGIGYSNPSYKLDVNGDIRASDRLIVGDYANSVVNSGEAWLFRAADRASGTLTIQLGGSSAASTKFEIVDRAWTKVISSISGEAPGGSFTVQPGGNVTMMGGNVGIGTTTPEYTLDVNGNFRVGSNNSGSYRYVRIYGSSASAGIQSERFDSGEARDLTIQGSGANTLINPFSGNVGIGTTAPNDILSLANGGSAAPAGSSNTGHNFTSTYLSTDNFALANYGIVKTLVGDAISSSSLWGGTASGNIWSLNSGNVGIGVTSPAHKLELVASTTAAGGIGFGTDTELYRSAAHTLALASGDSLNLVSGNLQVAGTNVITSSRLILGSNGTVSAPTFSFSADTNTGMYRGGTDILRFSTAGADRMTILANGNVGIGTTNPGAKLDVSGGITLSGTNQALVLGQRNRITASYGVIQNTQSGQDWFGMMWNMYYDWSTNQYRYQNTNSQGAGGLFLENDSNLSFRYASGASTAGATTSALTTLFTIKNSGNVGIGTTAPNDILSLASGGSAAPAGSSNTGHNFTSSYLSTDNYALANYGIVKTLIDSYSLWDGTAGSEIRTRNILTNVAIGTTSPGSYKLYVQGDTNITGKLDVAGAITGATTMTGTINAINVSAGTFASSTGFGNFSFMDNLGIGTNNPNAKLHVYNTVDGVFNGIAIDNRKSYGVGTGVNETSRLILSLSETGSPYPADRVFGYMEAGVDSETSSGNGWLALGTRTSGSATEKVRITSGGNVGIGTTNPGAKLTVNGSSSGQLTLLKLWNSGAGSDGDEVSIDLASTIGGAVTSRISSLRGSGNNWYSIFSVYDGSSLGEKMRITSTGNVGINTTDPSEAKLVINAGTGVALKAYGHGVFTGTLQTQTGSDFAEEFATTKDLEPGTVVVMDDNGYKSVKPATKSYDKTVVGIVSNNPSIIAGKIDSKHKAVVAMMGVVKVKVTNANGSISRGDLLTTSNISGHAMKTDGSKPGTIIGKALETLQGAKGEINVLVNLQ